MSEENTLSPNEHTRILRETILANPEYRRVTEQAPPEPSSWPDNRAQEKGIWSEPRSLTFATTP